MSSPHFNPSPEILSPVGNWEMLRAAIHNGADAVYLGMPEFNARGRAATIEVPELDSMIKYAHLYGVRVLLAFNVLIFERELKQVVDLLKRVLPLAPDALIVQDIGLVRLIRALAPEQVVHASTQMTISSAEGIALVEPLGMRRYVLAREVSLEEMKKIRIQTSAELEVFVHGALCVSYSGQCLTSESVGGRSANRGQCAQSCRLPYDLIVDGEVRELGDKRYLVSPKDLCAVEDVNALLEIGINSFKIEGRLKSAEYVASTTDLYRRAIDKLRTSANELEKIYSRGFYSGWMHGVNHQILVDGRYSSHLGLFAGKVLEIQYNSVLVELDKQTSPGDGLVFFDATTENRVGAPLYEVFQKDGKLYELTFSRDFSLRDISPASLVFINSSPSLSTALQKTFNDKERLKKIPLFLHISGTAGMPLRVKVTDPIGSTFSYDSENLLQDAKTNHLSDEACRDELGALSDTVYTLGESHFEVTGGCFLHNKQLKQIRRQFVADLNQLRTQRRAPQILDSFDLKSFSNLSHLPIGRRSPKLSVLIRDTSQLPGLSGLPIDTVYLDLEFGKEYSDAVLQVRAMGYKAGIATTRILKPGENAHLKVIERIKPDCVLVRNLGALHILQKSGLELIGDFSLNISNSLSAAWFAEQGLNSLSPSLDLNKEQLIDLLKGSSNLDWEVTLQQYTPAFHMEHCVFAAFLSKGSSYRDCGRPCEKHRVQLRGVDGKLHPLKADAECRNTMFNGVAFTALSLLPELLSHGVSSFRVEGLFETAEELRMKLKLYLSALSGELLGESALRQLGAIEQVGISSGQLHSIKAHKDRKKAQSLVDTRSVASDPGLRAITGVEDGSVNTNRHPPASGV